MLTKIWLKRQFIQSTEALDTMIDWVLHHELWVRFSVFSTTLGLMTFSEMWFPHGVLLLDKLSRWKNNFGLLLLNTFILRVSLPLTATAFAAFCAQEQLGLFHQLALPWLWQTILGVIALDFIIWGQHVLMHKVPLLWRLHRVHHSDIDLDVSTGIRFHPIEIIISMVIKFLAVLVLGPSVLAVLIFEVLLNASAMFNHANLRLPQSIDHGLRYFIVTPAMHRIHHSVDMLESNANFGFNLSCWDRWFHTYSSRSRNEPPVVGVIALSQPKWVLNIWGLLSQPLLTVNTKT